MMMSEHPPQALPGAYATTSEQAAPGGYVAKGTHAQPRSPQLSARLALYLVGVCVLGAVLMLPCWNAIMMFRDPILSYFIGTAATTQILMTCVGMFMLFFLLAPGILFISSTNELKTMVVVNSFLILLGTLFIVFSGPLHYKAYDVSVGLFHSCQTSPLNHHLFLVSQGLQALRASPDCEIMPSVERCAGFQRSESVDLLKTMEMRLRCSGFCYEPPAVLLDSNATAESNATVESNATADVDASTAALLESGLGRLSGASGPFGKHAAHAARRQSRAASVAATGAERSPATANRLDSELEIAPYPPTLFSKANFQASCDGMASRHIKYLAGDVASGLFWEGIVFIFASITVTILRLIGMTRKNGGNASPRQVTQFT